MTRTAAALAAALCWLDLSAIAGGYSYQINLNADACHEIHLGRISTPAGSSLSYGTPNTSECVHEIRSSGAELYFAVACKSYTQKPWPLAMEKYAVNLNSPGKVRRIDEAAWSSASPLPHGGREVSPEDSDAEGVHVDLPSQQEHEPYKGPPPIKGPLLRRSGPKWFGEGSPVIPTILSGGMNRAAVNSWDGVVSSPELGVPGFTHMHGHFWIDMYNAVTAEPLIRIRGSFHGLPPVNFMSAAFYSDRYYMLPSGHDTGTGFGMQQILICDLDTAASENSLKQGNRP